MIRSPITVQLSPGAQATVARLKGSAGRKAGTLAAKVRAAKAAFRETSLQVPDHRQPTCFVD